MPSTGCSSRCPAPGRGTSPTALVFRTARALPSARGSSERPRRACSTCDVRVAIAPGHGSPSSCARPTRRPRFVASNCRRRKGSPTSTSRGRARSPPHKLVLICGHGTRDTCCAVRGTAVHAALASHLEPDQLWISSHQGGHRFAANVLVLPAGIHLGRLTPDTAPHAGRSSARRRDRPRALPRADRVPAGGTGR